MKKYVFLTLSILFLLGIGACSDTESITNVEDVNIDIPLPEDPETVGYFHTEFLRELHTQKSYKSASPQDQMEARHRVANQILTKYGQEPMSADYLESWYNYGAEMARNTTEVTMEGVLFGDELIWWDRYSWEARSTNARKIYNKHCRLYGAPERGSALENVMTTIISSCEEWTVYRPEQECYMPHEDINGVEKGWVKNLIRFTVAIGVDGTAGGLAGAGTSFTGPGAAVVGGIVGGLASEGADNLLFG